VLDAARYYKSNLQTGNPYGIATRKTADGSKKFQLNLKALNLKPPATNARVQINVATSNLKLQTSN